VKQITAQLSHACSNRGADMGRPSFMADNPFAVKFHLHAVPLDSGGYDSGGAYWGSRRAGERLYRAWTGCAEQFMDATSREHAKTLILADWEHAKFYR
jgi:hypothetical protein